MPTFRNTTDSTRVYPDLTVHGRTLQLEPGETVDLDEDPEIVGLDPVAKAKGAKPKPDPEVAPDVAGRDMSPPTTA